MKVFMKVLVIAIAMIMVSAAFLLGADIRPSTIDMSNAKVSTETQARSRLYEHLIQVEDGGLPATQSGRVIARFKIGFRVPDFAGPGDRIWLIHVVDIDNVTVRRIAWINAESGAVIFPVERKRMPGKEELQLHCSMARTEFVIGEVLPPPKVTLRNVTGAAVDVIGPTITVIGCTLVQPDKATIPLYVAMPTGVDPRRMPSRELKPGAEVTFAPEGIWFFEDGVGFRPYRLEQEGCYEFKCHYEEVASNTIAITVRGKASEPAARPDQH